MAPAILSKVNDVNQDIIKDAVIVLHVFSFFPFAGMLQLSLPNNIFIALLYCKICI